jgi:hypothetical protein
MAVSVFSWLCSLIHHFLLYQPRCQFGDILLSSTFMQRTDTQPANSCWVAWQPFGAAMSSFEFHFFSAVVGWPLPHRFSHRLAPGPVPGGPFFWVARTTFRLSVSSRRMGTLPMQFRRVGNSFADAIQLSYGSSTCQFVLGGMAALRGGHVFFRISFFFRSGRVGLCPTRFFNCRAGS